MNHSRQVIIISSINRVHSLKYDKVIYRIFSLESEMDEPDLWTFVLLHRLPTICECVQAVATVAPSFGGKKQDEAITNFSISLRELWVKSFGEEYIVCRKTVTTRLKKHLKVYASTVQKSHGSKRANLKKWKIQHTGLLDLLRKECNPDDFNKDEKDYYYDQVSLARKMALSSEIDHEYEDAKLTAAEQQ